MMAAAERVGIKENFDEYVDVLEKFLRQLRGDVDKLRDVGMNAAKVVADTVVEIIDASNSLIAICSRMDVKQNVLEYTKRTSKESVNVCVSSPLFSFFLFLKTLPNERPVENRRLVQQRRLLMIERPKKSSRPKQPN